VGTVGGMTVDNAMGTGATEPALESEGLSTEHTARGHELDQLLELSCLKEPGDFLVHCCHHVDGRAGHQET
jgi:hypothetical protein